MQYEVRQWHHRHSLKFRPRIHYHCINSLKAIRLVFKQWICCSFMFLYYYIIMHHIRRFSWIRITVHVFLLQSLSKEVLHITEWSSVDILWLLKYHLNVKHNVWNIAIIKQKLSHFETHRIFREYIILGCYLYFINAYMYIIVYYIYLRNCVVRQKCCGYISTD